MMVLHIAICEWVFWEFGTALHAGFNRNHADMPKKTHTHSHMHTPTHMVPFIQTFSHDQALSKVPKPLIVSEPNPTEFLPNPIHNRTIIFPMKCGKRKKTNKKKIEKRSSEEKNYVPTSTDSSDSHTPATTVTVATLFWEEQHRPKTQKNRVCAFAFFRSLRQSSHPTVDRIHSWMMISSIRFELYYNDGDVSDNSHTKFVINSLNEQKRDTRTRHQPAIQSTAQPTESYQTTKQWQARLQHSIEGCWLTRWWS